MKNIFAPREDSFAFAMKWTYNRNSKDLSVDIKNLKVLRDNAVVTHLYCKAPMLDGFAERMKKALRMPKSADHPMLV